jgi:hypothetical protein
LPENKEKHNTMKTVIILSILAGGRVFAQKDSPQQIQRQRQEIVAAIQTDRPESVGRRRWVCFNGGEPARVREARAGGGFDFTPDAADSCLAALRRKGRDHALLEAYRRLVIDLQGDPDTYAMLPKAIGNAVLSGDAAVSLGNGKGVKVDPALALDAGYTAAYMNAAPKKEGLDPQKLKSFAESCLDQQKDAATCFSVGFTLGSYAVSAQ